MRGYRDLADDLRRRIAGGEFPAGTTLPRIVDLMAEYDFSRQTVREAIGVLADEGLVVTMGKGGTLVRQRTRIQIPLHRYNRVLSPGGSKGPWETACAEQGLEGMMKVVHVSRGPGPESISSPLGLPPGAELVHRRRHAIIAPDDVVQVQDAWYSAALADEVGIAGDGKVTGGVFGAFTAVGCAPATVSEEVEARRPTLNEAAQLRISGKVPVIAVERLTRDAEGRVLEVLRTTAAADRVQLVYSNLPLEPRSS